MGWVRPGTTATHQLLPLTPITIKPTTSATTYYDGWQGWLVSMVDVSLRLQWVAGVVTPGTTAIQYLLSLSTYPPQPPSTTATTYSDDWRQWGGVRGWWWYWGDGSNPNELKSPRKQHVFLFFFLLRGGGLFGSDP